MFEILAIGVQRLVAGWVGGPVYRVQQLLNCAVKVKVKDAKIGGERKIIRHI